MTDPAPISGEEVLAVDGVTHVVRIGATVRRPVRPFTATVQAYLAHLHARRSAWRWSTSPCAGLPTRT